MTDDEYLWEPAADVWTVRPQADGTWMPDSSDVRTHPSPLTTIAWRIAHITDVLAEERNGSWLGLEIVAP